MEYVEGDALRTLIPPGGLDLKTFLEWFTAIADALSHAHDNGIIHRDIKPNNIMITPSRIPKVLDFGLARIDRTDHPEGISGENLTKTGQVLGTPAYMSPEQAEGKEIDNRSDIFSLGVVMYEAFAGVRPFKGDSYASVVSELMTKEPKHVAEIKPGSPYLLSRLIMKCLSKEPHDRYQSMNEVRLLLTEIGLAVDSDSSLSKYPQAVKAADKASTNWIIGISAILIALLGGFGLWAWLQTEKQIAGGVARFYLESPDSEQLSILAAKISPDGKELVFTTFRNENKPIYIRPLDQFKATPIPGTERGRLPFFSPDGKWIGFSTDGKAIRKIPKEVGTPLLVANHVRLYGRVFGRKTETFFFRARKVYFAFRRMVEIHNK